MSTITVKLPPIFARDEKPWQQNRVVQLQVPAVQMPMSVERYERNRKKGFLFTPAAGDHPPILALTNSAAPPDSFTHILRLRGGWEMADGAEKVNLMGGKWVRHPGLDAAALSGTEPAALSGTEPAALSGTEPAALSGTEPAALSGTEPAQVKESWAGAFSYRREDPSRGVAGLRSPQLGALHAVHAHWTVTDEAATVVMPTGTGKTETMLSVLVTAGCPRILVVVPTAALRAQIAEKFITFGVLKQIGVLADSARCPVVGILQNKPQTIAEVDAIFEPCNVIVSTMHIAGQCAEAIQQRMAELCPYLFIDEAHHVAAATWERLKASFQSRRILQFTATPFRNDDRPIGGKIIFNYPLQKAQEEGYFREIRFTPVREFDLSRGDRVIAETAVHQLRTDLEAGYDHLLMARVGSIPRAAEVFAIYEQLCPEFKPVQIHTGIHSRKAREGIKEKIVQKASRVVVCVDMLGEGFDLPELKIAAFHDVRKSLPITIQLTGRFTRAKPELGIATIIANIADVSVQEELRKLYGQNSDWNILMRHSSAQAIGEQVALQEFLEGFTGSLADLRLDLLEPGKNVLVYRTSCTQWHPEKYREGLKKQLPVVQFIDHDINREQNCLIILMARRKNLRWSLVEEIHDLEWELLFLFWNRQQQLLFIHSSCSKSGYRELAEAVAGRVERFRGVDVFRCFAGINRLHLHNVGLTKLFGRLISYTMRAGSDVGAGLAEAQKRNTSKTNIFGSGFNEGPVTVGCAESGRFWSSGNVTIRAFTSWCTELGKKLVNENIDPNQVLEGTLVPVPVGERPCKMPIFVDWPKTVLAEADTAYEFVVQNGENEPLTLPLFHTEIGLVAPQEEGDLRLEIRSETFSVPLKLQLFEIDGLKDYKFSLLGGQDGGITIRRDSRMYRLPEFFYEHPPEVWFVDGSSLRGNLFTELPEQYTPYPAEKIKWWDWTGTNIRKESQGVFREPDSIQHRVFQILRHKRDYNVLFDDDDAGESADVVGIYVADRTVFIEFYHLKYAHGDAPGARIADLYEVCGQAQKSVHWLSKKRALFTHLFVREPRQRRVSQDDAVEKEVIRRFSRFEVGDADELQKLLEMSHSLETRFRIFIVQPGLSVEKVTASQRELLSVTENYLKETYNVPFGVIGSP